MLKQFFHCSVQICLAVTLLAPSVFTQKKIWKTSLLDVSGEKTRLDKVVENRPCVLIYLGADCPICQKYVLTINGLQKDFPEVAMLAVFPKWTHPDSIPAFSHNFGLKIPAFSDTKNRLARRLGARVTPEVFFFSPDKKLLYSGAIDNWFFALGRSRPAPSEHFLREAMRCYFSGEKAKTTRQEPVGCVFEK